jgi:hypothetical protein
MEFIRNLLLGVVFLVALIIFSPLLIPKACYQAAKFTYKRAYPTPPTPIHGVTPAIVTIPDDSAGFTVEAGGSLRIAPVDSQPGDLAEIFYSPAGTGTLMHGHDPYRSMPGEVQIIAISCTESNKEYPCAYMENPKKHVSFAIVAYPSPPRLQ